MDKDYAPLSTACVRSLNDKMYDKRKLAALEIEKMVKDFHQVNNHTQIKKLLKVLGQDFAISKNPQTKKGGLIGLAAIAVGLGKDAAQYSDQLIAPILANFSDADLRVRYFACESLYNVVKVTRADGVLPHFADIFNALSKLVSDPDINVKNGSELLDKLLKDIVTESGRLDLVSFTPLLRERMYSTNPHARQFLISWVGVLNAVPDIRLVQFLPELLDALFLILADKNFEIKKMCESLLNEFLVNIKQDNSAVDLNSMINILIVHSQSNEELLQFTAITWIKEFVQVSGPEMLSSISGILMSILPCLSYENDQYKNIKDTARTVNFSLQSLVSDEKDTPSPSIPCATSKLDVASVVDVLSKHLVHTAVPTTVACLRWIGHLHSVLPNRFFIHLEDIFPILFKLLSDPTDEVIQTDAEVLCQLLNYPYHLADSAGDANMKGNLVPSRGHQISNPYFDKFVVNLLNMFRTDPRLLADRGSFIIRQLCVLLDADNIYKCIATVLLQESDVRFLSRMVETLNTILLTSSELFELRTQLKEMKTKESVELFKVLYHAWTHNPVALLGLCLLTQSYDHVTQLLRLLGDVEITLEFLTELDKLVQLIESPIFAYLRLELLDVSHNAHLVHAMFGILMLLPQSEAFRTLRSRLKCIPKVELGISTPPADSFRRPLSTAEQSQARLQLIKDNVDFHALLELFIRVSNQHKEFKIKERSVSTRN